MLNHACIFTEGPYLISSEINETPVFWKVEQSQNNGIQSHQLVGTESAADASFFYIIPTGDLDHPSDFHIAYWTRKRQFHMHVDDLYRTYNIRGPPLPHYLTFNRKCTLSLEASVEIKQACFSLHSRVQTSFAWMMCTSTPVNLTSWLEGEQFYIRCCHHSIFKTNGYLAVMKKKDKSETKNEDGMENEEDRSNSYKLTTVFSVAGKKLSEIGMLFRLHPGNIRDHAKEVQLNTQTEDAPTTSTEETTLSETATPDHAAVEQFAQASAHVAVEQSTTSTIDSLVNTALIQLLIPAAYIGTTIGILYVALRLILS